MDPRRHRAGRSGAGKWTRRRKVLLAVVLSVALVGTVAGAARAFPTVAATTCPTCYGMEELQPDLYVERNLSADRHQQVVDFADAARRLIHDFYGSRDSSPRILACTTETCYRRIGGGRERGVAVLNRAIILSPRGLDPVIASHEMSHVELHHRLGWRSEGVPQWFDEGLAVVVSNDPRYLGPSPDRCKVDADGALPETLHQWLDAARADEQVYARSACRVVRWMDANGGPAAVRKLIEQLNSGNKFDAVMTSR